MRRRQFISLLNNHHPHTQALFLLLFLGAALLILSGSVFFFSSVKARMATFLSFSAVQANINKEEEYQEKIPPLLQEKDGVILHGLRTQPIIALTFDAEMTDGMKERYLSGEVKNSYDERITNTLIATQTKATFFLTGMWMQLFPKQTNQLAENRLFELASHSYADTSFEGDCYGLPTLPNSENAKVKDIEDTQKLLYAVTGKLNRYFRFPGGCYGAKDLDIVQKKEGLLVVHWDVAGDDGFNENTDQIVQTVVDRTQNGSIIILHLNGAPTAPKTADALPEIINKLKEKGFTFVTVSELLHNN